MKKYNPDAVCVKCGGDISDEYNPEIPEFIKALGRTIKAATDTDLPEPPEHIARTCKNCRYSWHEKPLDACPEECIKDAMCGPGKVEVENNLTLDDMHGDKTIREHIATLIEVRDIVKGGTCTMSPFSECVVSAIGTNNMSLFNSDFECVCCPEKTKPVLIRKGPKVHRFEGVSIDGTYHLGQISLTGKNDVDGGLGRMQRILSLTDVNKSYTLTFTEEATK